MVQSMGSRAKMLPLEHFLLAADDKYLAKQTARMLAVKEKDLEKVEKSWRPALLDMCRRKGVDFDALALPKRLENATGLRVLCERQRIVTSLQGYTEAWASAVLI